MTKVGPFDVPLASPFKNRSNFYTFDEKKYMFHLELKFTKWDFIISEEWAIHINTK